MSENSIIRKVDFNRFCHCPYSFFLLENGEISEEDLIDDLGRELRKSSRDFKESVIANSVSLGLTESDYIFGLPEYQNEFAEISGRPDGLRNANSDLLPVLIKAHKDISEQDVLELAFFWRLLEPFRSTKNIQPSGVLVLKRDSVPFVEFNVPITERSFEQLDNTLASIKNSRIVGVKPRVCKCNICTDIKGDEVIEFLMESKDIELIKGIGADGAEIFRRAGFSRWTDLLERKPEEVVNQLVNVGERKKVETIIKYQRHAKSLESGEIVFIGDANDITLPKDFIAFDLEWNKNFVWAICASVVVNNTKSFFTRWAVDEGEERIALQEFSDLIDSHPGIALITWNGNKADIPTIEKAVVRLGMKDVFKSLRERHLDLLKWSDERFFLPIYGTKLKKVSNYFGLERSTEGMDGAKAIAMYEEYKKTRSNELREFLTRYCEEDVESLISVMNAFRKLDYKTE